ncbi:hypothetical protein BCR33DRAFT_585323 [Rhizoclosmatium globosum]|uniref:Uncharacterized protein n=1 Tax=Rhizoclosmatium globosum TaxID=329046 RepID=A0A1Y2CR96_9FUNG|nr:hypothetical protein BCR33DRAFT_585323 [Rhizoclosmatium globosum]|eukprot:ORY49560.1 hypothetical protein BCR33DRAFT_585323 [Rhizoclosmatium globosum]
MNYQEETSNQDDFTFDDFEDAHEEPLPTKEPSKPSSKITSKAGSLAKLGSVDAIRGSASQIHDKSASKPSSASRAASKPGSKSVSKASIAHETEGNDYNFDDFDIGGHSEEPLAVAKSQSIRDIENKVTEEEKAKSKEVLESSNPYEDEFDFDLSGLSSIPAHIVAESLAKGFVFSYRKRPNVFLRIRTYQHTFVEVPKGQLISFNKCKRVCR